MDNSEKTTDVMNNGTLTNGTKRHAVTNNEHISHQIACRENGKENGTSKKLPTLTEIKAAIPKHCFKSNLYQSFYYVVKDLILIVLVYLAGQWIQGINIMFFKLSLFPIYWFVQGTLLFAVFVLGHDCNHGSFSSFPLLNDCLGTILHATVLTPYYAWKISHKHHHNNTGNMDKDEIFYPIREKENNGMPFLPFFGLGLGWNLYLFRGFGPRQLNHWVPRHNLFSKHILGCLLSTATVGLWIFCLYNYTKIKGWPSFIYHYAIPILVCGSYIVVVTFLHHSDVDLPWYGNDNWDNVKGKLSSVDREYGAIHDVIHTIGTHQVHHLFPIIPHYHLREATLHFRKTFPHLVHINESSIIKSFWTMFFKYANQYLVPNDTQIYYYK